MPITKREDDLEDKYMLDDDSSDEEEDESNDESNDDSGDDSESDSDSDSDDSDSGSGSGSDSDDSDSDDESNSDSDSDASLTAKKKGKNDEKKEEKKDEEDDQSVNTLYKIRQISSKLSWLLDDLHKTFKPKSVPKIDPRDVFPYPYEPIPQFSPSKHYQHNIIIESSNNLKSPISSPIRHGNAIDRGTGGNYIFPPYALPPSKNEIKKLYRNYSDVERQKIQENQRKERDSRFSWTRRVKSDNNLWERSNFSDEFISASNNKRNKIGNNSRFKSIFGLNKKENEIDNRTIPHTFDELYAHYDEQRRLIRQKQARMNGMKNRMYWFRKNTSRNMKVSEKKPLMDRTENENEIDNESKTEPLYNTKKSLKETEKNLLNKAAQILLGGGGNNKPATSKYNEVCPDSPDSLQQKILHIASDEDDENRMPKFV